MARQIVVDILGDAQNFTRATREATIASESMSVGMGKASGVAKTLEKDLTGMGRSAAGGIPVLGKFGSSLNSLPVPAMAAAAAIGLIFVAGKSIIEISDKWEAAQKGLKQSTESIGGIYASAQREVNEFIQTNKRFITSQSEVVDAYAALLRQGNGTAKAQEDLNLALDLSKLKHIDLATATTLLQQVEMGRGRALLPLGIQMKEYPVLMESATQAAKKLEVAQKAVAMGQETLTKDRIAAHDAQVRLTQATHAHGAKSDQARLATEHLSAAQLKLKDDTAKLTEATDALAAAHDYTKAKAAASAEIHDLLHQKLDGGRKATSDLEQAQNSLGNAWQTFAQGSGPAFLKIFTAALEILSKVADAIGWVLAKSLDLQNAIGKVAGNLPVIGGIQAAFTPNPHAIPAGAHVSHRAGGGDVSAYGNYVVGERGPEILQMGSQGGTIIPNGGGAGLTVNLTVQGFVGNSQDLIRVFREGIRRLDRGQT